MPFTAEELSVGVKYGLDFHLKNNPIDQITQQRPLLKKLVSMQRTFPGAKQYVTVALRVRYESNFQWYRGAQQVTYNSRDPLEEASFPWSGWHDGFYLDEDRLAQNNIVIHDGRPGMATNDEWNRLEDLVEETLTALREGCEEKWDYELHLDGTQNAEAFGGLDLLVDTDPTTGSPGGIDRSVAANSYWRNYFKLSIAQASLLDEMEKAYRSNVRHGGKIDYILAGEDFIDDYRAAVLASGEYQLSAAGVRLLDGGIGLKTDGTDTGLSFKGVPIMWDPTFADLDDDLSPTPTWKKRCYFLQCRHIRLRPLRGHDMISRRPPRVYNQYVWYWAITWKGALTMDKASCHSVLALD